MTLAEAGVAFVTERPIPGGAGSRGRGRFVEMHNLGI